MRSLTRLPYSPGLDPPHARVSQVPCRLFGSRFFNNARRYPIDPLKLPSAPVVCPARDVIAAVGVVCLEQHAYRPLANRTLAEGVVHCPGTKITEHFVGNT
jgi:hypothetical protein